MSFLRSTLSPSGIFNTAGLLTHLAETRDWLRDNYLIITAFILSAPLLVIVINVIQQLVSGLVICIRNA